MATVNGTNPLDALKWQQPTTTKVPSSKNGTLNQSDFFALLTKELANQDPTKPVDNNQMISQMTGFSTTNGVSTLNDQFTKFASSMSSNQALQASSLVGRSVLVDQNSFNLTYGNNAKGKIQTDSAASQATIYVENKAGQVVQTVPVGDIAAGSSAFSWDGKMSNGQQAPAGSYRFRVFGLVKGQKSELHTLTYSNVDSVTMGGKGGKVLLNLNNGNSMALSDVVEVAKS